jgi:hypothetical protein
MNLQASILVILFPGFISIARISIAPSLRINFFAGFTLSIFETRQVNQRHWDENTWLSFINFLRNIRSPPLHQSSASCPPKFREGGVGIDFWVASYLYERVVFC